jgi:hypothetical protein
MVVVMGIEILKHISRIRTKIALSNRISNDQTNRTTESRMDSKQQSKMLDYEYESTDKIMNNELATNGSVEVDAIAHEQC